MASRGLFRRRLRTSGQKAARSRRLVLEALEGRLLLAGSPVISELMAINDDTLADENGDYPDWIEVYNPAETAVSLDGWYLTNDATEPTKWQFPDVSLDADEYRVVFASEKNRTDPASELHTNFRLDGGGQYLALVHSNGSTVIHEYAPRYPQQLADVSYGIGGTTTQGETLVQDFAPVKVLVPDNDVLGVTWTGGDEPFDDSGWISGNSGVGYDTELGPEFEAYINFQPDGSVVPEGYEPDSGEPFGDRGNGFAYGWDQLVDDTRERFSHPDKRYDTINHLQKDDIDKTWEIAVPNGTYDLFVVFGEIAHVDQINNVNVEGTVLNDPDGEDNFDEHSLSVTVNDGRLTIRPAPGASNAKIAFIDIDSIGGEQTYLDLIETDLRAEMYDDPHTSAYTRETFEVSNPAVYTSMTLRMMYDDGFVAYLNGEEIERQNAPGNVGEPPPYDETASATHPDELAVFLEDFDVSEHTDKLVAGTNVLAIHGLNWSTTSTDFLMVSELVAELTTTFDQQYFEMPTPGLPNTEGTPYGWVADTRFSVDRGFYETPISVEITTDTTGAEIRYTTDGSTPTATTGTVYAGPITVDTTTTIRAAAYAPGYIPTNVDTQTYVFLDDVIDQDGAGFPGGWGHRGADYAMDFNVVSPYSATIVDDLKAVPTLSLVMDVDDWFGPSGIYSNPSNTGAAWQRVVSAELIQPDGGEGFQIDATVQIQGGSSVYGWKSDKVSMRLKFNQPGQTKLKFPLFGDQATDSFDTIVLDARLNNVWNYGRNDTQRRAAQYTRDQYVADIQAALGGYAPHGASAHLYINGLYWGLYRMHERPDESFAAAYLGGDKEDYYVLRHDVASDNVVNEGPDGQARIDYLTMIGIDNLGSSAQYQLMQQYLDVPQFIDYMITNFYVGNTDWAHQNWYATRNAVDPDGRWRYHSWDAEKGMQGEGDDVTGKNDGFGPTGLHQDLMDNADYRMLFADHVYKHFFNDGVLTPDGAIALYQIRLDEVDRAVVGESARWGDNREDQSPYTTYTRDIHWINERDRLLGSYFPQRTQTVLNQFDYRGLYPDTNPPVYSAPGGVVPQGFALSLSDPNSPSGTIYYTQDGSDPRASGGGVHGAAYSGPLTLDQTALVKARVLEGGEWSALNEAQFIVGIPATDATLVVSEVNYHPYERSPDEIAAGYSEGDFEFIELQNVSQETIDLTEVEFVEEPDGITFNFTGGAVTILHPGEMAVVVKNTAAFPHRYPGVTNVAGFYSGSLANGGEDVQLKDALGGNVFSFGYDDGGNWPGRADGDGSSLELIDPWAVPHTEPERTDYLENGDHWRSSIRYGGTPGEESVQPSIVVNEVLTHTDYPLADTIELHNITEDPVDMGGWWLSDSNNDYQKFQIPPTVIPGGGYAVFSEGHYVDQGGQWVLESDADEFGGGVAGFGLNGAEGDDVWLTVYEDDGDEHPKYFVDHVDFDAAANGESFGRWYNGEGRLYPMVSRTLGQPNSGPRIGPLVMSEVMYSPPDPGGGIDPDDIEFVEIYNPTSLAVDLWETWWVDEQWQDYGWTLEGFEFVPGTTLGPAEALLVVSFDTTDTELLDTFKSHYGLEGAGVQIVGGYNGRLDNGGETLRLQWPDQPMVEGLDVIVPYILEDEVRYDDKSPWPAAADGTGSSLHRQGMHSFGNHASSWAAATRTPGQVDLPATVLDRLVFYNHSSFDEGNAGASEADDGAIAPDKAALLPGNVATFANYTSYSRGINGIMVDLQNSAGTPLAADFAFKVGNDDDPAGWTPVTITPVVDVRPGPDAPESDRVTIIFPDNTIQNQWLEVTLKAGGNVGLTEPDVFYFGNAIGETGNSTAHARVDADDVLQTRNNPHPFFDPADLDCPYDFDRDERVNAHDIVIARNHQTTFFGELSLIDLSESKASQSATRPDAAEKAPVDAKTSAHDAILERTAQRPWSRPTRPRGGTDWLWQLETSGARDRPARSVEPADRAVDLLLATCRA